MERKRDVSSQAWGWFRPHPAWVSNCGGRVLSLLPSASLRTAPLSAALSGFQTLLGDEFPLSEPGFFRGEEVWSECSEVPGTGS